MRLSKRPDTEASLGRAGYDARMGRNGIQLSKLERGDGIGKARSEELRDARGRGMTRLVPNGNRLVGSVCDDAVRSVGPVGDVVGTIERRRYVQVRCMRCHAALSEMPKGGRSWWVSSRSVA